MTYHKRLIEANIQELGSHFPVVVLTGARQVGKSTLLKHLLPQAHHITFDPVIDVGNARKNPELFLDHLQKPVILDEIQYAPELLPVIKRRIVEHSTPGQYWITGSQNLGFLKNVSEILADSAALLSLYPMTLSERYGDASTWINHFIKHPKEFLKQSISHIASDNNQTLSSFLWRGGYPGLIELNEDRQSDVLNSYLQTYFERDIRLLNDISDLQEFARFLQLSANLTAQEILFAHLGREIGISPQMAQRWLTILKNTYQWIELPAFSGNTLKRLSLRNKGYFLDTGMATHLMHISTPKALLGHPKLGPLFETYVVNDILRQLSLLSKKPTVYHWRSHGGAELDLLLEMDNMYYPIEIKCKTRPASSDIRGIQAFKETYPDLQIAPALVICAVNEVTSLGKGCYAIPFDLKAM